MTSSNAVTYTYGFTADPRTWPMVWYWVTPVPQPKLSGWDLIVTYLQALYR